MIRSRRSALAVALAVAVAVALASGTAAGQDRDVAAARRHFRRAGELFHAGDFRAAHDEYERAYAAAPLADFLFDMAQCQRSLGDHARARDLYRRYLATEPPADKRSVAEQLLAEVEARIAETTRPTAEAPVATGPRPAPRPTSVRPARSLSAPAAGPAPARAPAPDRDRSEHGSWRLAWILAGAGAVALAGTGLYFGLEAGRAQDALDDPALDCSLQVGRCLEIADAGRQASVLRNVSLGVGALALAGAVVLMVVDLSSGRRAPEERAAARGGWTW